MVTNSQLAQNTTKSAKTLAQQIAKQMAREVPEVLKTVSSQVTGAEKPFVPEQGAQPRTHEEQSKLIQHQQELQDKMKSTRLIEAFQRELNDIRKQDVFKDLQSRIAQGEDPPLEDFSELSMEQKQVLKAQIEAVRFQRQQAQYAESKKTPLFGSSKRSRRFGAGQKQEAEKQQTRVEKPVPPSG